MKKVFKKIILSDKDSDQIPVDDVIKKRWSNIKSIWHNEHQDDIGLEKIIRLLLAFSQFLFPGIYIKQLFGSRGIGVQEVVMDLFIVFKLALPFLLLYHDIKINSFWIVIVSWLLLETILYIATLAFASDLFDKPRSYRRSLILLFLDYGQIVISFAYLYTYGENFNTGFKHWFDPIYFSVVTSASVGYGDFFPVTTYGKMLASAQIVIFFLIVMLLFNFFSFKMEQKGYFGQKE
ncbi:MAG: hypothetical protein RL090_1673 [Bacteroidota bacterium]